MQRAGVQIIGIASKSMKPNVWNPSQNSAMGSAQATQDAAIEASMGCSQETARLIAKQHGDILARTHAMMLGCGCGFGAAAAPKNKSGSRFPASFCFKVGAVCEFIYGQRRSAKAAQFHETVAAKRQPKGTRRMAILVGNVVRTTSLTEKPGPMET